jgi:hypothetical protein
MMQPQRYVAAASSLTTLTKSSLTAYRSVSSRSVDEEALKCLLRVVLPFHVFNSFEVTYELRLASNMCTFQRTYQPS